MIKVVKKILEKINLIGIAMMITAQAAFADSISSTKLATGTTNLIQDVTAWIIGLGSGVTILMVIYCLLRRNMAEKMADQNDCIIDIRCWYSCGIRCN